MKVIKWNWLTIALAGWATAVSVASVSLNATDQSDVNKEPPGGKEASPWTDPSNNTEAQSQPKWQMNVRDFGAKGDGITDDTTAIQNAIDAVPRYQGKHWKMGTVFFPPGKYLVSRTISIPPCMYLQGVHPWSSTIILAKGTFINPKEPKAVFHIPRGPNGYADTCFTPGIENLGFTTLGDNPGGVFVLFNCAQVGHVRDCLFTGGIDRGAMWACLWLPRGGGNNALIEGCEIRGGRVGILMEEHSDGVVLKCSVQHQVEWGIEITDCYRGVELIGIQGENHKHSAGLIKVVNSNVSIMGANLWNWLPETVDAMIEAIDSDVVAMNLRGKGIKNLLVDRNGEIKRSENNLYGPGHDGTTKYFNVVNGNPKGWSNCIFDSSQRKVSRGR
jgi:hypothetical protein